MTFDRTAQQKQCVGLIAFHWVFFCRREALFYNDRINGATKYVRTVLILHVQDIKKKQRKQKPSGFIEHESWKCFGKMFD